MLIALVDTASGETIIEGQIPFELHAGMRFTIGATIDGVIYLRDGYVNYIHNNQAYVTLTTDHVTQPNEATRNN